MNIFSMPRFSDWRISGSAGASASVGTPGVVASLGGQALFLPLENTRTHQRIELMITGLTLALGVGASTPVELQISPRSFPSNGIGSVVSGFSAPTQIRSNDFRGKFVRTYGISVSASGSPWSGSIVAILFFTTRAGIVSRVIPSQLDDLALAYCGGLFYGTSFRTGVFAGGEEMVGGVVARVIPQ